MLPVVFVSNIITSDSSLYVSTFVLAAIFVPVTFNPVLTIGKALPTSLYMSKSIDSLGSTSNIAGLSDDISFSSRKSVETNLLMIFILDILPFSEVVSVTS